MKVSYIALLLLSGVYACKAPTNTIVVPEQVYQGPLDSTTIDRPVLAAYGAGTTPKPPFGPITGTIRLRKVLENGGVKTEYLYDSLNRLTETRTYAGQYIFTSWLYFYRDAEIAQAEYRFNTGVEIGFPQTGYLQPSFSFLFNTRTPGVLVSRNYRDERNNLSSGGTDASLWFDPAGRLVWEASQDTFVQAYPNGTSATKLVNYRLYVRDTVGNVVRYKNRDNRYHTETELLYQYDDAPNPYYTTGDVVDLRALSPANVLLVQTQTATGPVPATRYQYTYRPDGYPATVSFSRNGSPVTQTFIYNR